jgi:hypothetical protein
MFIFCKDLTIFDSSLKKFLKLRFCEKDTTFLQNHHHRFVLCSPSNGQIYGGDFVKFCGLLRIYEL